MRLSSRGLGGMWCWDRFCSPRGERCVDSATRLGRAAPASRAPPLRLGTVGRPGSERSMGLPCRMCPLGNGGRGLALTRGDPSEPDHLSTAESPRGSVACEAEGCGPDSLWANSVRSQPIGDTPRSGSPLRRCGRSMAVFTEGVDSSPLDWGSAPEACENGGLGTLASEPAATKPREGRAYGARRRRDDF